MTAFIDKWRQIFLDEPVPDLTSPTLTAESMVSIVNMMDRYKPDMPRFRGKKWIIIATMYNLEADEPYMIMLIRGHEGNGYNFIDDSLYLHFDKWFARASTYTKLEVDEIVQELDEITRDWCKEHQLACLFCERFGSRYIDDETKQIDTCSKCKTAHTHVYCIKRWLKVKQTNNEQMVCPHCQCGITRAHSWYKYLNGTVDVAEVMPPHVTEVMPPRVQFRRQDRSPLRETDDKCITF